MLPHSTGAYIVHTHRAAEAYTDTAEQEAAT